MKEGPTQVKAKLRKGEERKKGKGLGCSFRHAYSVTLARMPCESDSSTDEPDEYAVPVPR